MRDVARSIGTVARRLCDFVAVVARRFYEDRCLQHAAGLAYVSLLSLVPLLALMFAVLKGLGVQRRLEALLLSRLALDPEVTERIIGFIDRTNVGTLGVLGSVALVLTVVSVLGSVEASFNAIWRVRYTRSWWRKATDYLSVVLLTPFLLLTAVAITSSVQEQRLLHMLLQTEYVGEALLQSLRLAPVVINAVALAILYAVMPNRRPHTPSILVGAVLAGVAWQVVQWSYVTLQIGVARYNAIYGALSQLPVILVWLYVSWTVVLAGAQMAAVFELGTEAAGRRTGSASRWAVALHLLVRAAERFRDSGGGFDPRVLAHEMRVEADLAEEVAEALVRGGYLAAVESPRPSFVLARDPATIELTKLESLVEPGFVPPGCDPRVRRVLDDLDAEQLMIRPERRLSDLLGLAATPGQL